MPKCITSKTKENLEMSGTGSSAQSECSAYTKGNSENFVNFQQRFKYFNPEAQLPHSLETNSLYEKSRDTTPYDPNHNIVQHCHYRGMQDLAVKNRDCAAPCPDKRPQCNIQIHYNIRYKPPPEACQCGSKSHCSVFRSDIVHGSDIQHAYREERFICDV